MNARIGYRFTNGWKIVLDGFNIANSRSDMIDYPANVFGRQDFALFPGYTGGSALGIAERVFKPIDPPAFHRHLRSAVVRWNSIYYDFPAVRGGERFHH